MASAWSNWLFQVGKQFWVRHFFPSYFHLEHIGLVTSNHSGKACNKNIFWKSSSTEQMLTGKLLWFILWLCYEKCQFSFLCWVQSQGYAFSVPGFCVNCCWPIIVLILCVSLFICNYLITFFLSLIVLFCMAKCPFIYYMSLICCILQLHFVDHPQLSLSKRH